MDLAEYVSILEEAYQSVTINLPYPISVNRIWRGSGRRVYRSKEYEAWKAEAGASWLQQRRKLSVRHVKGRYTVRATFWHGKNRRRDLDNLIKAPMDFAQSVGIIENDSLCEGIVMRYGNKEEAPLGARLIFSPY